MSEFEFVFSLFGLLLGLSLVELLGGLARTIEAELTARRLARAAGASLHVSGLPGASPPDARPTTARSFRAGSLTILLGLFVMLDILSFWLAAWSVREQLSASGPVLLGGLLFAGSYYLAAHLVFPREPTERGDLDAHYFEVKRLVLGAVLALAAIQIGYYLTLPAMAARLQTPATLIAIVGFAALLIAGIAARGRIANAVILVLLIARYLYLGAF